MRFLLCISLTLFSALQTGCVSLEKTYSTPSSKKSIQNFCKQIHQDYNIIEESKEAMGDCAVQATIVEQQNLRERNRMIGGWTFAAAIYGVLAYIVLDIVAKSNNKFNIHCAI